MIRPQKSLAVLIHVLMATIVAAHSPASNAANGTEALRPNRAPSAEVQATGGVSDLSGPAPQVEAPMVSLVMPSSGSRVPPLEMNQTAAGPAPLSSDAAVREFQSAAMVIPTALIAHGIRNLGALNLPKLIAKIPEVALTFQPWLSVPAGDGKNFRLFTSWQRTQFVGSVGVNRELWERLDGSARSVIALNAYLNALGFYDTNYRTTIALWFLALDEPRMLLTPADYRFAVEQARIAASPTPQDGSGGGDLGGILYKQSMLRRIIQRASEDSTSDNEAKLLMVYRVALIVGIEVGWGKKPEQLKSNSRGTN